MKSRVLGLSLAAFLAMTAAASAADVVAEQGVINSTNAPVTNLGGITSGGHIGDAFSVSIGATGAAAQASITNVNQPTANLDTIVARQDVRNDGVVTNGGVIVAGPIAGAGTSLTVSAVGSVAGVGSTNIGSITTTNIAANQLSFNNVAVSNAGLIATNTTVGEAISTSITAVGAIAQASVTNINGLNAAGSSSVSSVQTVMNMGAVNNIGVISASLGGGNGSSLSISAVGAAGSVSVSNIR